LISHNVAPHGRGLKQTESLTMTTAQTAPVARRTLIVVECDKGGVGKTTTARLITDGLIRAGTPFRGYDAEVTSTPLVRSHTSKYIEPVDLSRSDSFSPILDRLMDNSPPVAMIDTGARSAADFTQWLLDSGAIEAANSDDAPLRVVIMHVLGPTVESIDHLAKLRSKLGAGPKYVAVRNAGVAQDHMLFHASRERAEFLEAGGVEIEISPLDKRIMEDVDAHSVGFANYAQGLDRNGEPSNYSFTRKGFVRAWTNLNILTLREIPALKTLL
jgi:hypothetical protein